MISNDFTKNARKKKRSSTFPATIKMGLPKKGMDRLPTNQYLGAGPLLVSGRVSSHQVGQPEEMFRSLTSHLDVSGNNGTPKIIHFNRVFHYKPSILGYPYFWKHPFGEVRGDQKPSFGISTLLRQTSMENRILQWDKRFPPGGFFFFKQALRSFSIVTQGVRPPNLERCLHFLLVMWKEAHCCLKPSKILKIKQYKNTHAHNTQHKTQANTQPPYLLPYVFLFVFVAFGAIRG